jgi:enoyl-CoA hydratase
VTVAIGNERVISERDGDIAVVTLNRPEVRNALNRALLTDLVTTLDELAADESLRVLILTGAGERAFSAGADLVERRSMTATELTAHTGQANEAALRLERFPVPVIAAIRGYALAGGAELAIACDLRIAGSDAAIGFPEVKVGVFPGAGGLVRLPRIVGSGIARDLLFTGRRVGAGEAFNLGLYNRVVPPDDVMSEAIKIAQEVASNAPLAIRAMKRALVEAAGRPDEDAHQISALRRRPLDETADYQEGLRAFAEKRPPGFEGR